MKLRVTIAKIFIVIVAIQILNMSIYNGEFATIAIANSNSSIMDETDSFVEFIVESIKHKNIDTDSNHSSKESRNHKDFQLKLFAPQVAFIKIQRPINSSELTNEFIIGYNYLFCKQINPPPPKSIV